MLRNESSPSATSHTARARRCPTVKQQNIRSLRPLRHRCRRVRDGAEAMLRGCARYNGTNEMSARCQQRNARYITFAHPLTSHSRLSLSIRIIIIVWLVLFNIIIIIMIELLRLLRLLFSLRLSFYH